MVQQQTGCLEVGERNQSHGTVFCTGECKILERNIQDPVLTGMGEIQQRQISKILTGDRHICFAVAINIAINGQHQIVGKQHIFDGIFNDRDLRDSIGKTDHIFTAAAVRGLQCFPETDYCIIIRRILACGVDYDRHGCKVCLICFDLKDIRLRRPDGVFQLPIPLFSGQIDTCCDICAGNVCDHIDQLFSLSGRCKITPVKVQITVFRQVFTDLFPLGFIEVISADGFTVHRKFPGAAVRKQMNGRIRHALIGIQISIQLIQSVLTG